MTGAEFSTHRAGVRPPPESHRSNASTNSASRAPSPSKGVRASVIDWASPSAFFNTSSGFSSAMFGLQRFEGHEQQDPLPTTCFLVPSQVGEAVLRRKIRNPRVMLSHIHFQSVRSSGCAAFRKMAGNTQGGDPIEPAFASTLAHRKDVIRVPKRHPRRTPVQWNPQLLATFRPRLRRCRVQLAPQLQRVESAASADAPVPHEHLRPQVRRVAPKLVLVDARLTAKGRARRQHSFPAPTARRKPVRTHDDRKFGRV